MAIVKADVKLGDLLGMKVTDGLYVMEDGKLYTDTDGEFASADGDVEIPNYALNNAEDAKETMKLRAKAQKEKDSENDS